MNRIETIFSLISWYDKVVDVGCDQAKLSLMLSKRGQYSIACDISENVIDIARHNISRNKYIDLRVSNGLENVCEGEADTLVLAGMGTHTILDILKNTKLKFKRIITISNNYHDILRNGMNDLDYMVEKEIIIKENNIYYNLITFIPGNTSYNEFELIFGKNNDSDLYQEYLMFLLDKYKKIKLLSKESNEKINKRIKLLEEYFN